MKQNGFVELPRDEMYVVNGGKSTKKPTTAQRLFCHAVRGTYYYVKEMASFAYDSYIIAKDYWDKIWH